MSRKNKKGRTLPQVHIQLKQLDLKEQLLRQETELRIARKKIKQLESAGAAKTSALA